VPATLALSLCAAMLLNAKVKGRAFFRTVFFLPYVTTWVAIAIVWNYLYHREFGLANWLLTVCQQAIPGFEGDPVTFNWLAEPRGIWEMMIWGHVLPNGMPDLPGGADNLLRGPSLALFSIVMTSIWRDIGYFMIIFLAGLQNIDKANYEAADIDGATSWQKFWSITFPLLSPVTFFLLIISCIGAFKEFVPMFIMTPNGGPDYTTAPLVFYMFEAGFTGQWELSYASAVAYILTIMILVLTIIQNSTLGRKVEYAQ
jgi:multiple sugar transport system permease protein